VLPAAEPELSALLPAAELELLVLELLELELLALPLPHAARLAHIMTAIERAAALLKYFIFSSFSFFICKILLQVIVITS